MNNCHRNHIVALSALRVASVCFLGFLASDCKSTPHEMANPDLNSRVVVIFENYAEIDEQKLSLIRCDTNLFRCAHIDGLGYIAFYRKCRDVSSNSYVSPDIGRIRRLSIDIHGSQLDGGYVIDAQPDVVIMYKEESGVVGLQKYPDIIENNIVDNDFFKKTNRVDIRISFHDNVFNRFKCDQ